MRATFWSLFKKLQGKQSIREAEDDVIALASATALLFGAPTADAATLFFEVLSKKNKLACLGETVLNWILKQHPEDCSGRYEQMWEAYETLCLTAFFDELDAQLPDRIREFIRLNQREKQLIYQDALSIADSGMMEKKIPIPTFLHGLAQQEGCLTKLYEEMSTRLLEFVQGLAFKNMALELDVLMFENTVHRLPEAAIKRFRSQHLILCSNFNEFYIFTRQEWEKGQEVHWEERFQSILSLALDVQSSSQVGMAALRQAIIELPGKVKQESVQIITRELIKRYQRLIERPLIETAGSSERLTYPRISQAFIPQTYKALEYSGVELLEPPETWEKLDLQQNMMSFWAQYLLDPSSTDRLLLILGEPGSGKSLLTKVICARLISPNSIFLRIPLREHNMDDEIETIVCNQLEWDGDAKGEVKSFKWFAKEFPNSPLTLLFDGYDEVLRATGNVYRGLLRQIRKFQERCQEFHRPVRIVVTSRTVLIDKADIPEETVVIKLQEFDTDQKAQWIDIWNRHNHAALSAAGINDFALPQNSRDIEELSKQPLLLMMLAIYDADFRQKTNALMQKVLRAEGLDRTGLYDELLRRFIQRELRKKKAEAQIRGEGQAVPFEELDPQEQLAVEDEEMRRLGIAALGMLGRGRLFIQVEELDADLLYMETKKATHNSSGKTALKDAELLFGSFFFIHKSQVARGSGKPAAAFEFLHKTFYEFLVSDLILRCLIDTAYDLHHKKNDMTHYQETLYEPEAFPKAYYATLSGVCLYAEPEIICMMAEWADRRIVRRFHENCANFEQVMEKILTRHITLLQNGQFALPTENPSWFTKSRPHSQVYATYFMNLLVLQILTKRWIKIDLDDWRFLAQYVRLYLTPFRHSGSDTASTEDFILKFMAQFQISKEETAVVLQRRTQIREFRQERQLENHIVLADFMLDEVAGKFYRLHSTDVPASLKKQYRQELYEQDFDDLRFELSTDKMQESSFNPNLQSFPVGFVEQEVKYLRTTGENAADIWGWMAHLYQLACKTAPLVQSNSNRYTYTSSAQYERRRIIRGYDTWSILGQVIFTKYVNQTELIRLYIALLEKLGCQDILLDPGYINDAAVYQPSILPEIVDAILEVGSTGFYDNEHYPVVTDAEERLISLSETLPKETAALLRYLYLSKQLSVSAHVWDEIERRWPSYLQEFPEGLSSILQVYLEAGKFESVRGFFQRIEGRTLYNQLYPYPEVFDSFLNIMQIVGEDAILCTNFASRIGREPELVRQRPHVFFRLIYHAIAPNCIVQLDRTFWVRFFLQQYRKSFGINPVEAVRLLIRIFDQGFSEYARIVEASVYSLQNFQPLLERSAKMAIHLLIMFERIKTDSRQSTWIAAVDSDVRDIYLNCTENFPNYIKRCLQCTLSAHNEDSAYPLAELLDGIGTDTKKKVVGYLQKQLHYIWAYSEELAEKVEDTCKAFL